MASAEKQEELQTSPDHDNEGWPPGVKYIVGNEACERFSYYGMKAILYVHLASLFELSGLVSVEANAKATSTAHLFNAAVYAFPMVGAILADRYWGKYRTILWLSLMYCIGHGLLSIADIPSDPNVRLYFVYAGLACIAIGAGGIKPCVSANVGDQFGRKNWFRVRTMFQIFYFSINFGSFFATLMIPAIRGDGSVPWRVSFAFGLPGILMAIATLFFWLGKGKFVHIPPKPAGQLGKLDTLAGTLLFMSLGHLFFSAKTLPWWGSLIVSLVFFAGGIAVFLKRQALEQDDGFLAILVYTVKAHLTGQKGDEPKASADPTGTIGGSESTAGVPGTEPTEAEESPVLKSSFWAPAVKKFGVSNAEGPQAVFKVLTIFIFIPIFWAIFDQHSSTWIEQAKHLDLHFLGTELLPSQVPSLNPLMVMGLIIIMNYVYKGVEKMGIEATALRRMVVGTFVAGASFAIAALIQQAIDAESVTTALELCKTKGVGGMLMTGVEGVVPGSCQAWVEAPRYWNDWYYNSHLNAIHPELYPQHVEDVLATCNEMGIQGFFSQVQEISAAMGEKKESFTDVMAGATMPESCEAWKAAHWKDHLVALKETVSASKDRAAEGELLKFADLDITGRGFESSISVGWQVLAFLVLTTSEVMVSITSLEFAYTQAPKRMKSTVMGLYLFTVAAGNIIVAIVSAVGAAMDLVPAKFFWFFAGMALFTGIIMGIRSMFYVQRDFPQD